jgi:hypothetical protein
VPGNAFLIPWTATGIDPQPFQRSVNFEV